MQTFIKAYAKNRSSNGLELDQYNKISEQELIDTKHLLRAT